MASALLSPLFGLAGYFADFSRLSSGAVLASGLLLAAIWQGALLAAIAALALRLVPGIHAAARFAIWFSVFIVIAALPILGLSPRTAADAHAAVFSHAAWFTFDPRWTLAIAILWAAASLVRALTLVAAALRVRTLSRRAIPLALPALEATPARRARVCSSNDVDRPTVIGFVSPKILIPAWLLQKLTPAELEQIVLHEAAHLHRADDWLNLLQKVALVLFPLNPALAWVERRLCFERELACDERVLSFLTARNRAAVGYASCLATLAGYRLERRNLVRNLALALGALGTSARESELGRRVARILRPAARMRPLYIRLAVAVSVLSLLFVATELERCPQIVSFAAPAPGATLANLAQATPKSALVPGYRAVAARLTLPVASQWKSAVPAPPHLRSTLSRNTTHLAVAQPTTLHAVELRAVPAHSLAAPRMVATRQPVNQSPAQSAGQPQRQGQSSPDDLVITRFIVTSWQSSDGARFVHTSAVISSIQDPTGGAPQPTSNYSADRGRRPAATASAARTQQVSQPISPYAAVPVPGGWLIFQL